MNLEPLEDRCLLSLSFGLAFGFGGAANDTGSEVAIDSQGNMVVAGTFVNAMDADPGPGEVLLSNGIGTENFVAKYSAAGDLLWAHQLGGTSTNSAATYADLALDAQGNVFVTGILRATSSFGSTTLTREGASDAFLTKLDATGNFQWATRIGASLSVGPLGSVTGSGVAVDPSGNVVTTGFSSAGTSFVARHDTAGDLAWEKTVGVQSLDIAVDGGAVYVTGGYFGTVDFNPGSGTYNLSNSYSGSDAFVLKLDAAGDFVWAGSMGGTGLYDYGYGIAVDGSGNVHIAGQFVADSGNDFDPGPGTITLPSAGANDGFVVKLDRNRILLWARSMGGTGYDYANGIELDGAGNVYTTGSFGRVLNSSAGASADFDPGSGNYILTSAGGSDVFVCNLSSAGNFIGAERMGGAGVDVGGGLWRDDEGKVYTIGRFQGPADFDPGPGAFTLNSTAAADGTPSQDVFVLKLIENESPPPATSLGISDVTVTEGNSGTTTATFTVTRAGDTSQEVTVAYATADGSATAGSDYQAVSETLTFAPGETSKTVTMLVNGDRLGEPNETFFVNLSSPSNALIADGQGVGAIVDDEPRISISDVAKKEGNSGTHFGAVSDEFSASKRLRFFVHRNRPL